MISDYVRDNGLAAVVSGCNAICLCSAEPTTYTQAVTTYNLGTKTSPSISLADHTPDGRAAVCASFSGVLVSASGGGSSGMYWAAVDTLNSRLLSTGQITGDSAVVDNDANTWGFSSSWAVAAFRD